DAGALLPILVITAEQTHKLRALQAGAKDFISTPFDLVEVKTRIHNILEGHLLYKELETSNKELEQVVQERTGDLLTANTQLIQEIAERKKTEESLRETNAEIKQLKDRLQAENIYLQKEVDRQYNFGEIIGQSPVLEQVFTQIEQVAPMLATVLLLGETGTGKGVVARTIHGGSSRKDRPLITVNCSALPTSLIESELFGRTIFLDEIGELPLELQSKLLRILQDGEFERLGSSRTIKVDVRIIAATNR
ncbi:MAG: sigma 54-interacting transcriptional regulator, partial [Desulfotignum sp.]